MALVCTRRILIGDVDGAGVAYTGRLIALALEVLELGWAQAGLDLAAMLRAGRLALPLVNLTADFAAPLRHGETVACHLLAGEAGTTSCSCVVELRPEGAAAPAAQVRCTAVCIDGSTFRAVPLPDDLRAALARLGAATADR